MAARILTAGRVNVLLWVWSILVPGLNSAQNCLIDQIEAADLPDICIGATHTRMIVILSFIWIRKYRGNQVSWTHRVFSWTDCILIRWELTSAIWLREASRRRGEENDLTESNIFIVERSKECVLAADQPCPDHQAGKDRLKYSEHKTEMRHHWTPLDTTRLDFNNQLTSAPIFNNNKKKWIKSTIIILQYFIKLKLLV